MALNVELKIDMIALNAKNMALNAELKEYGGSKYQTEGT